MIGTRIRWPRRSRRIAVPIHLPAHKSGITSRPITPLAASIAQIGELLVPLSCRADLPVRPAVKRGDRVAAFAPLGGPADPHAIAAFSPADAQVVEITTVDTQYACDLPAIRLRLLRDEGGSADLGEPGPLAAKATRSPVEPQDLREALLDMARIEDLPATLNGLAVLTTFAGAPEPVGNLLRRAAGNVSLLVVSALQSEPRLGSHVRLMRDAADAILAGVRAMMGYLLLRRAVLLVHAAHSMPREAAARFRAADIDVIPVRTSFPGSVEPLVLRGLFGRRVPDGGTALDVRCLMLGADAVWQAGTALLSRRPAVLQPITIAGDCLPPKREGVFLAPVGLSLARLVDLLDQHGMLRHEPGQVLLGGRMTGTAVTDLPRTVITQTTQAVLLMRAGAVLRTTGCIRCGWCIYGCPVGIDPIAILDAFEGESPPALGRLGVRRCIECGVCSYVCPSHLPLAQAAKTAKVLA